MPELPDVETYRRYVDGQALRQSISHVRVAAPRLLADTSPQRLGRALARRRFERTRRHGKFLFIGIDRARWLVLHFGMTGRLVYFREPTNRPQYTQFLIDFAKGRHLAYVASRKLGRVALTDDPRLFVRRRHLGPDALALDLNRFRVAVGKWRGGVKGWLMNQQAVAGIGNVYSDEILFQAHVDPRQDRGVGAVGSQAAIRENAQCVATRDPRSRRSHAHAAFLADTSPSPRGTLPALPLPGSTATRWRSNRLVLSAVPALDHAPER